MTEVIAACSSLAVDAKYLTAMSNAGFTSLLAFAAFDQFKLVKDVLPDAASVFKLCDLLTAQDATIKKETDAEIHVVNQIALLCAAAFKKQPASAAPAAAAPAAAAPGLTAQAQAEKEKADDDAFGVEAYRNVTRRTLLRYPTKYCARGKDVKTLRAEFNRGTISKESYNLKLQKDVTQSDAEKTACISSTVTLNIGETTAPVEIAKYGHFMRQLSILEGKIMAAGLDEVKPSAATPRAGSAGTKARVQVADPSAAPGATRNAIWHVMPETWMKYRFGGQEAMLTLTLPQLNSVHDSFHERTNAVMQESDFNYGSALESVMDVHSWHSILATLPAAERSMAPLTNAHIGIVGGESDAEKELRDLRSAHKRINNELEQARTALRKRKADDPSREPLGAREVATPNATAAETSHDFQRSACRYGASCRFVHSCDKCGSTDHGSLNCPRRR